MLAQLGKPREAVKAAISELAVRPDNEAAFGILLSDKGSLIAELQASPAPVVAMVENLIQFYTLRYQQRQ